MNWSISVVFLFNVARKSSFSVVRRDNVILGRLSCGCVDRGRVVLYCFGGVISGSLGGVISGSLGGVISGSLGGVMSRSLGVAAGNRVVFRKIGAISSSEHSNTWEPRCSRMGQHAKSYSVALVV